MSDIPIKTYPPSFVQAMIADHEAEQAGATPEDSSAVQAKGDAMSEIKRFTPDNSGSMLAAVVWDSEGGWVRYKDHLADVEQLTSKRDAAQAEVERLTQELEGRRATNQRVMAERDAARANSIEDARLKNDIISRLVKQRDAMQAEIERLRANGQGVLDTSRPTDEDIWREAFMVLRMNCYEQLASLEADRALAAYRKRWPR